MEIWKFIKGYEGFYMVSNKGNVKSVEREIVLKDKLGNDRKCIFKEKLLKKNVESKKDRNAMDRYYVVLSKHGNRKRFYIHRLVASEFIPNTFNMPQVNHIDGNSLNNNFENLEWVSQAENIKHAFENNLIKTQKPVIKLDPYTLMPIETFRSEAEACRNIGVSSSKISRAIKKDWKCGGFKWKYK